MFTKRVMLAVGTLILGAATAGPAMAGPRKTVAVEVAKVGIEVHADRHGVELEFRGGRRHGDDGRFGRGRDRGRSHGRRVGRDHECRYVPGHYESRTRRVWIPGYTRTEYVPPVYETRYGRHGRMEQILVRPGYNRCVVVPGRWECRSERVWVPGHSLCGCR